MIRLQISFDEKEYAQVRKAAKVSGVSMAEFARRSIRQMLPARGQAPWMRYAGVVESGDPRSSQAIDDIIYGSKD